MISYSFLTKDEVRNKAKVILGFENTETTIYGVGQIYPFNQLGLNKLADKLDS